MKTLWGVGLVLGSLLILGACDDGGATGPESAVSTDLEAGLVVVAAEDVAGDLAMMREPGVPGLAFPGPLRFPPVDGSRPECPRVGDGFRCPPEGHDGLTFEHEVGFLDQAGNVQEAYDEETTEAVRFVAHVWGEIEGPMGEASVDRRHELAASGLFGDNATVVWNGTGSSETSRERVFPDGSLGSYESHGSSSVDQVVVPYPTTDESWPLSGTITREISLTTTGLPGGDRSVERTVSVTFNGTRLVTMTVDGEEYTVDLALPRERPRGRHGPGGADDHRAP